MLCNVSLHEYQRADARDSSCYARSFDMSLNMNGDLIELLLNKLPTGHWLICIICLLVVLRLMMPRFSVTFKFEIGSRDDNAVGSVLDQPRKKGLIRR
jgi:hypothetical protein